MAELRYLTKQHYLMKVMIGDSIKIQVNERLFSNRENNIFVDVVQNRLNLIRAKIIHYYNEQIKLSGT